MGIYVMELTGVVETAIPGLLASYLPDQKLDQEHVNVSRATSRLTFARTLVFCPSSCGIRSVSSSLPPD